MKSLLPFFTARFTLAKKTNIQVVSTSLMGEFHHQLIQHVPKTYHKSRLSRLAFSRPALSVCIALAGFSLPSLFTPALAAPTGGDIVGGTGTISKDDLATIIKQTSQNIAIDWDSYNIDATEVVKYIQPNGQSIALNRILGVNGSTIAGKIESNGQVILINPNGLVFTDTSVLNVGGIIASGLNMNTSDFMNGDYIFDEVVGTEGTVINRGIINASLGGLVVEGHGVGGNVALIGKQVINEGLIEAHLGSVTLAAGKQAVLTFDSSGVLGVRVSKEILQEELGIDPAVVNSGEINAAGGRVLLTASTSQDIFSQAVNAGIDEATSAVVHADGSFTLGGGSDVLNSGLVDVSTGDYSQTAGQIVLIGENVTSSGELRADSTVGDAGSIELNSRDKTLLTDNSMTSAQGLNSGKGGEIKVLGGSVGLFDQSVVDVSGVEGGGQVLIGGDYRGENIQVTNASGTFVAKDVVINADAISAGDGGEVIIWADKSAKVYGTINAKGGVQSGDGGFVETSAEFVDLDLQVNVSALNGESGEWLIDPYNITISNSSASNVNDKWQGSEHIFTNDGGNSNVTLESLYSALWDGAYVTVETSGGNSDGASEPTGGNITLVDSFDMDLKAGGGSATLELLAHHDININANIYDSDTTDSQKLNIILNANSNYLSGDGSVNPDHLGGDVNINADIFTYGGSFSASGDNITILSTKQINTTGKKNTAGGNISLTANNGFISTGALTSNAGTAFNAEGKEAGDISLFATANITVDGIMSAVGADGEQKSDSKGKAGGNAGDITIQTEIGTVDIKNEINNSGGNADGASNRLSDSANGGQSGLITIGAKDGFTIDTVKLNTITSNGGKAFGNTGAGGAAQAITVTANSIELAGDIENKGGALDANGSASTLGAGGDVIFNGAVTLKNAAISINTTGSIGGDIRFKSTLNGTQNLTLTGKDIQFTGEVGNASPLSDLIVTATGGIQANGGINANSIDLQGATTVTTGALTATNIIDVAASEITVGALNANSIKLQGATTVTTGALTATTTIDVSGSDISVGTLNTTNNTINLTATDNSDGGTATITLNGDIISGTGVVAVNVDGALNADALITINHSGDFTSSNITLTGAETGTSKLQASSAQANTWDITNLGNTVAGLTFLGFTELVAGSEGDTFNIGATVGNLTGGTGSDTFVLKTDGNVTGIIDGVSGDDDKLVGWNSSTNTNSWTVDTTNTVTNTVNSVIFSNIDVLQGGDGKDEFTVNASIKDVLGGEGDDVFDIKSTSLVTGSIDGGNGTNDVLNLMTAGQTLDLSTLSNIEAVTAQSTGAANTLQAGNASSNTWNVLTTANSGQVGSISFSNFANLVAGSGGDIFNIDAAIGNLMGGDEVDTFNISATTVSISAGDNDDIINVDATSLITGSIDGGNGTNDVLNLMTAGQTLDLSTLSNIEAVTAQSTGAANTLQAGNTSSNTWNVLTTANSGQVGSISFSNFANLVAGSGGDIFNIDAAIGNLTGGDGVDTFNISATTVSISAGDSDDIINVDATSLITGSIDGGNGTNDVLNLKTAGQTLDLSTLSNIEAVTAQSTGAANTLQAGNASSNTWNVLTTANSGQVGTISFSNFANLVAGSAGDIFNIDAAIGNLTGGDGVDTFNISATTVSISAGDSDDIINVDATSLITGSIDGGNGTNDVLNLKTAGQTLDLSTLSNIEAVTAQSTGAANTLQAGNASSNTWNVLTTANSGQVGTISFSNFANLVAGSAGDIFNIDAAIGNLTGGDGVDTFNISATTVSISAGDSDDIINVDATSLITGSIDGGNGTNDVLNLMTAGQTLDLSTLSNIEAVTAQSTGAANTLQAGNTSSNTWNVLTTANSGQVGTISFSNFANLVAGSGGDIFNIDAAIGNLTGGAGNDTFTLLTNGFATTIDGGTSGTDELIGWNSAINTNTWVVDAVNTLSNGTNSVTFSNIDDLQGGTGIDNFTVNASIENINAGSGDDVINVSDTHLITGRIDGQDGANDTINLTAAGQTLDLATFSAVEFVNGFVSGTSTLQGSNTQINTWDITTLGNTVGGITFTNFADLIAGSQGDTFNINDSIGNLTGGMGGDHFNITASTASIDAGAGNDIINIATTALVTGSIEGGTGINDVLNITTEAQTLDLSTLVGIEAVNALSTGGPNTLQAGNSATNTWNVTSTNTGNVAGITFSNFADLEAGSGGDIFNIDAIIGNLKGGDGIDVFNIVATTASVNAGGGNDIINIATRALVTGNIDGSTGSNDRLNLTTAAQTLDLSTLLGIEAVNALSTGASNTLQAGNTTTNTWNITSANTGNVEGISFSNFADLEAGSGGDIFNIDAIIGHLKGGNGSDTFNITATTASVNAGAGDDIINIDATALVTGSIDGSTGSNDVLNLTSEAQTLVLSDLVGIEAVNALATGGNNTLQGQDTNNTWLITDTNKGTLNNTITFSNFANLIGGNKDDNFSIGSFSEIGKIDGGNATTIDSVTITDASQTIVIGTDAVNIESYTATSGVNTLQGADTNNTWNINGSNQGTLNGDIGFANFANLVGGNQDDSFSLGSFVNIGKIDGGDASTIDSVTVTDASQTIVIGADAVNIESYIATSGINTLQGENVANTWLITDANKGTLNNTIGFSNFANLVGGNQNDAFSLGSFSEIGKIDGGDASTMDTVTVTDASQIVLIGTDAVNIESYVATSGTNTLQGSDDSQNTWNVTSANSGHVGSVSFTNFADLVAGSKGDTFNINYLIGNLTGGAGDDNFNINANANSLNAGLGNDTVTLDNINRVNIPMDGGVGDTDSLILTGASQDLSLTNISNFEIVEAQHSSVHTLTAGNDINTWTIDGSNSGDVAGVDFKGFSRLKGGTLADHFTVTETGKIDKMYGNEGDDSFILNTVSSLSTNNSYVDGGIGNDSLTVNTSSNTWLIKNGYDGEVENGLVVREFYSVENLSSAPGSSDTQDYSQYVGIVAIDLNKTTGIGEVIGNGRDSTVIGRDVTNTWLISGTDAGSVSYYDGFNDVTFVFSDVLNLTGGSGIDTFAIGDSGSLDGNIKGGGGVNTLLGSNIESTWNVTTENAGSLLYAGVTTNFEDVSELIGGDQIDTFNINALVNSLNAGSGNDQIYLKNIDIVNSVIDGGEGADTIHLLASNQVVNVATSMTGIEIVNGSVDAENTLQANNGNNIWAIDGANAGDLNGLRFTNFSHLEGGSSVDTFTFENNTATLNSILAGSGNDIVNMASIDPNIQIDAGEGTSDTLNITGSNQTVKLSDITNFEMVNAADGVNTLQAKDSIANTWLISANNTGTVDGVRFSNFGQLKGGDGIDNFTLSDIDFVSGLIDGGGGANTVNLTTANQTVVIEKDITNIGTLNASSGSNMLQASDISNEWNITDNDKGTVNGLSFSNFSDLLGGTGQDEFSLTSISQISGKIDGGLGNDSVMLSAANQHIILDADITRIELLHAAAGINTLQGADIDNTWNITGDNTGNVAGVTFDNISDIVGGNEVDNFNVSDISQISGLIDGAGGRDNLTLTGTAQTVELGVNVTQVENLVATEEDAHLVGSNNANVWTIDGENSGFLTNNTGTVNFSGFKNMTGGRSIDQFTLSGAGDVTGLIDGGSGSDSLEITANDIQIIELGNNTNDNLNVVNMESIVANSATENTLLAGNVSNTWLVNGNESGSVAYSGITTLFSNFDHLTGGSEVDKFNVAGGGVSSISMGQGADTITLSGGNVALISGGEGDDTFTVSGGTANLMQGDSGTDYVTYMLDNVSVTIGDDIVGFEGVTAQKGNGTITAQDDVLTTWVINELNKGTVTDTSALSTLLAFSGFSTVTGGSGIDNFTVSGNGVITNMINGGGSADTLNVILDKQSRTESAVINFNGGEGADVVNITGTANSFSETYTPNVSVDGNQFDQLHFTKENSSTNVAINFRDVTSVNDDIATTSLVINSGQNADTLYLDATQFSTDSASVNISFESLLKGDITIAGIGSSLVLTDSVDVNGDLSISANEVRQTSGSVNTDRLLLNNVIAMGVGDAIETNVSELLIADHSGDIYLNQSGDINFSQLSNSSGDVNINVTNGDVNASNGLTSSGNLTLAATKINLSGNNQLTGNIDLSANDIVLNNDALTRIVGLSSQNVSVTSTDSIIVEGDLLLASNGSGIATLLSSQGDVLLNGTTTADSLSITANNDVLINDLTAKNLTINAITGDIVGNGTVAISSNVDEVTTTLVANAGNITFTDENNDFDAISVTANSATITDVNGISVLDSELASNLIVNSNGEMKLGRITAGESLYFNAGNANIVSENSSLTAPVITLRATTGIGEGLYDTLLNGSSLNTTGAINTETALLSAINTDSGLLFINNGQNVAITDLRNKGDIIISNAGDITLQTTTASSGNIQGAIDANYGLPISNQVYSGSVAIINDGAGSVYTTGVGFNEPDIIAENLLVNSVTSFGTAVQPIRLRVNNDFTLIGSLASIHYYGAQPNTITTSSDLVLQVVSTVTGLSGQQLVEVEPLSEVDPAIFADVRNYTVDDISIYLPKDQRVDENEEEEYEEEYDQDI